MAGSALAIRRFALAVEAPQREGLAVSRRAQSAIRDFLPGALDGRLADDAENETVLLIRKLELVLDIGGEESAARLAERLADAIAAAIGCAVSHHGREPEEDGQRGEALPSYASPAARTGAFIAARLEGLPCDSWWFRAFEGVLLLPLSAAIRTVLLRDPASIPLVFASLDLPTRCRLAAALTAADADLLIRALADLPAAAPAESDWAALAAALRHSVASAPLGRAIEALAAMAARPDAAITGEIAAAARAGALFLARADRHGATHGAAEALEPEQLPRGLRAALVSGAAAPEIVADPSTPVFSPLGGHSLLLAALVELDLASLTAGWNGPAGTEPSAALHLLVLAAASGEPRLLDDPFWRLLLGVPRRLAVADLRDWFEALTARLPVDRSPAAPHRAVALPAGFGSGRPRRAVAGLARIVLRRFASRLPGFASASAPFLRANLLSSGATLWEEDEILRVRLERPPLDVLLSITGASEREILLPDGRVVRLERRQ